MIDLSDYKKILYPDASFYNKEINKYTISIGVGFCSDIGGLIYYSNPFHNLLDIHEYDYVSVEIWDDFSFSEEIEKQLNIPFYNKTKKDFILSYREVPLSMLELIINKLEGKDITPQKSGGNCKKCGAYDNYAPIDNNGQCLCYRCFGG